MTNEKYYPPGITNPERRHFVAGEWIEGELDLPPAPDWRYQPPPAPAWPRTEAFVDWCIAYQVPVACALWAVILAAWATALWLWVWG